LKERRILGGENQDGLSGKGVIKTDRAPDMGEDPKVTQEKSWA